MRKTRKYYKQYNWANLRAMRANNKKDPKECEENFKGKLVVITGTTNGIGYVTAKEYAAHGANLLCINRNEQKSIEVCEEISKEFGVECNYKIADFSRLSDIHKVADELAESDFNIDVLIHNAGIYITKIQFSEDDIEMVFQVNYLAAFIITYKLIEKLKAQEKARILLVNSEGHRFALSGVRVEDLRWDNHHYSGLRSYGAAKTAQLLSMTDFNEIFKGSGVSIIAMHPGDVKSNMGENNGKSYRFIKHKMVNPKARSPIISAKALYYLGVSPEMEGISDKFYNLTTEEEPAPHALDREVAEKLWDITLELGGLNDQ